METTTTQDGSQDLNLTPEQMATKLKDLESKFEQEKTARAESNKEAQRLHWIDKVRTDRNEFVTLYESDQKMANAVAEHFNKLSGDGTSAEEYYKSIKGTSSESYSKDEVIREVENRLEAKSAEQTMKQLMTSNGIKEGDDFGKDFISEFNDLMDGRPKTSQNIEKYFNKALKITQQTSKHIENYNKTMGELQGAGGLGQRSNLEGSNKPVYRKKNVTIFDVYKKKQ